MPIFALAMRDEVRNEYLAKYTGDRNYDMLISIYERPHASSRAMTDRSPRHRRRSGRERSHPAYLNPAMPQLHHHQLGRRPSAGRRLAEMLVAPWA